MNLYHGCNQIVAKPKFVRQNRNLDFGKGFYTTTNFMQAKTFAKKVNRLRGGKAIVNTYTINESYEKQLQILEFKNPDESWLNFVSANRNGTYNETKYDLIIGAVANDDVYATLQAYEANLLTKQDALAKLKIKELFNQYVFASNLALGQLEFTCSEEVE